MPAAALDRPVRTQDPTAPPNRAFWENYLCHLGFGAVAAARGLNQAFDEEWLGTREGREFAGASLQAHGDSPNVKANLLLAASYVKKRQTLALVEAVQAHLGPDSVEDPFRIHRSDRNVLAGRLFLHDAAALLAVQILDDWVPRRRRLLRMNGQPRRAKAPLRSIDWRAVTEAGLRGLGRQRGGLRYWGHVAHPSREEVVIALLIPGSLTGVRDAGGDLRAGHLDSWMYLCLFDGLVQIEITARNPDVVQQLAGKIAGVILGGQSPTYAHRLEPFDADGLQRFLDRLTHPDDDDFPLLELVGDLPGAWRRPTARVTNVGQERVERGVRLLWNAGVGLGRAAHAVHRVKVGFEYKPPVAAAESDAEKAKRPHSRFYRIELHFPDRDAAPDHLVVGYGTTGVPPDADRAFRQYVHERIGREVQPRSGQDVRRRGERPRPEHLGINDWGRLLGPHVERPAPWEREELKDLAEQGLVDVRDVPVFRCGDPQILRRATASTADCPGIVELDWAPVTKRDPFEQIPGRLGVCSDCGERWPVTTFTPPVWHRVEVTLRPTAIWALVERDAVKRVKAINRQQAGVLRWFGDDGRPSAVVGVGVAAAAHADRRAFVGHAVAWLALGDSAGERFDGRMVSVEEYMTDRWKSLESRLDLGPLGAGGVVAEALPSYTGRTTQPAYHAPTVPVIILRGAKDVYIGETKIIDEDEVTLCLVLAALSEALDDSVAFDPARKFSPAAYLADLINTAVGRARARAAASSRAVQGGHVVAASDVHQWVSRVRARIDQRAPGIPGGSKAVLTEGGKKGVGLGERFELRNFSLQDEAARYKPRRRRRGTASDSRR